MKSFKGIIMVTFFRRLENFFEDLVLHYHVLEIILIKIQNNGHVLFDRKYIPASITTENLDFVK